MVIAGIGIGSMMQVFVLSVQNAVPRSHIGSATALTQFGRQMGATLGVTIMGVIVNHGLPAGRRREAPKVVRSTGCRRPPAPTLADALHPAFLVAACVSFVGLGDRRPLGEGAAAPPLSRRGGGRRRSRATPATAAVESSA